MLKRDIIDLLIKRLEDGETFISNRDHKFVREVIILYLKEYRKFLTGGKANWKRIEGGGE